MEIQFEEGACGAVSSLVVGTCAGGAGEALAAQLEREADAAVASAIVMALASEPTARGALERAAREVHTHAPQDAQV